MHKRLLNQYRKTIAWFTQIPDEIYYRLDTSEFHLPKGKIDKARKELEKLLGHFVMTYDRRIFNTTISLSSHLCANLAGAILNKDQLNILQRFEAKFRNQNISFVIYKKPLKLIDPASSWFNSYFLTRL